MNLKIEYVSPSALKAYENNSRTHSEIQITQICASIREFGFVNPILIGDDMVVIAGHGRLMAANEMELDEVPVIRLSDLSDRQRRALVIADNKIALNAGWDFSKLGDELSALIDQDFDLGLTGFNEQELDALLKDDIGILPDVWDKPETIQVSAHERKVETPSSGLTEDDKAPEVAPSVTAKRGDVWMLGDHLLVCGDSTNPEDVAVLMVGKKADMVFTDPPYNVKISGLGVSRQEGSIGAMHGEFVMASGEMNEDEFTQFLRSVFQNMVKVSENGAIHYVCMDWRHMMEVLKASDAYLTDKQGGGGDLRALKQMIVWNKDRGGMGTFYRSKHELVFVFKVGNAKHTNNFELGQHGRYRTNVWDYPMVLTFMHKTDEGEGTTEMHPTVKPVSMIVDACMDCSMPGDIVMDLFGGSGSTLIACEKTGRKARLMELDPKYIDVIIKRWQDFTGQIAYHENGKTFEQLKHERE